VLLEELIGRKVFVPDLPEMIGALGAALIASEG
jgi:activator of 2-hydroxyglutaryl-CoA dehydratase